jgi:hypothetical protein
MLYDPKWEQKSKTKPHVRLLIEARAKIANEANWLCYCPDVGDDERGLFCAARAVWSTEGEASPTAFMAYRALERAMKPLTVPQYNDTHTHAEVLAAFDRAIATAQLGKE